MAATTTIKELLADAAKLAGLVVGRTIVVAAIGVLTSWALFFFGIFHLAGLAAAAGAAWHHYLWPVLFSAMYIIGAPILYYVIGKAYGIQSGLNFLVTKRTAFVWRYTLHRMFIHLEKKGHVQAGRTSGGQQFLEASTRYLRELPGIPWGLRHILRIIIWALPFQEALEESAREAQQSPMTSEEIAAHMAPRLSAAAAELVFEPDLTFFWILVGLQTGTVILIWVLL